MERGKSFSDSDRELVALALACQRRYERHSQRCPVWTRRPSGMDYGDGRTPTRAQLARCDCWIMRDARRDAEVVLDALVAEGWRPIHRVYGYHVDGMPGVIPPEDVTLIYRAEPATTDLPTEGE